MRLKSFLIAISAISLASVGYADITVDQLINGNNPYQVVGSPDGGQTANTTFTLELGEGNNMLNGYDFSFFYSPFGTALSSEASFAVWDDIVSDAAPLFSFNFTNNPGAGSFSNGGITDVGPFLLTDSTGALGFDFTVELATDNDANIGPGGAGSEGIYADGGAQFGLRFQAVPEPGSAGLLALLGVAGLVRRRKR